MPSNTINPEFSLYQNCLRTAKKKSQHAIESGSSNALWILFEVKIIAHCTLAERCWELRCWSLENLQQSTEYNKSRFYFMFGFSI